MREKLIAYLVVVTMLIMAPSVAFARWVPTTKKEKKANDGLQRVLVLDGSNVHNVGELHMHVGNWGNFGSLPGSANTFSDAPSAQWPAGSGIEYLYASGLWIGAIKSGVPAVTTAAFQTEFRPTQDPLEIIYRSAEGAVGGNRLPSPDADDDKDGFIDEDWLNGRDDDGDGLVDEDFAAVSKQMFSCWYTDDQSVALQIFPEHNPLGLLIRQESYQWEEDRFDDFVGIEFRIQNIGGEFLEDLYIGFFADCDAGPRDRDRYFEDDATGREFVQVLCTDLGPVQVDIAFTFDPDGDEGQTLGYFGVMFLGHTTDPTGEFAPRRVGISTYANFAGSQAFEDGGDPGNDFERYELLSQQTIERDALVPRDYRMLVSAGPFSLLEPDSVLIFQVCFVVGAGLDAINNAASAQLTYDGAWFNLDIDPNAGVGGRETGVIGGQGVEAAVDTCAFPDQLPISVPRETILWINNDCAREALFQIACGYSDSDSLLYRTGVDGKESQIHWIVGTAPPPPVMRIDDHSKDGVVIYWDNFSETVPDVKTQKFDFEGYRVWRADNWTRPEGTSAANGPSGDLWKLIFQTDKINNFGDDIGLDRYRYEPLKHILSPGQKRDFIDSIKETIQEFPRAEPPCPQGVTEEVCDTLMALARWELGDLSTGRQYFSYVDKSMHLGRPYFYSVTALDHGIDDNGNFFVGKIGDPSGNFMFVEPKTTSQPAYNYDPGNIYVVPNPATRESMAAWKLDPNNDDPTGLKVEFRNLPMSTGFVRVYTLAGDMVITLPFDGTTGVGTVRWDLVSRNAQDVTSGVYLYAIESDDPAFKRFIGKFVVVR